MNDINCILYYECLVNNKKGHNFVNNIMNDIVNGPFTESFFRSAILPQHPSMSNTSFSLSAIFSLSSNFGRGVPNPCLGKMSQFNYSTPCVDIQDLSQHKFF